MIQFKVLSGKMAGSTTVARRFPFRVGRSSGSDLKMEDPGVWDDHFRLEFEPGNGYLACPQGDALMTINGEAAYEKTRLRNGDSIEIGGARLQFWLSETRQSAMRIREFLVWLGIGLMTLAQVYLIYRLL